MQMQSPLEVLKLSLQCEVGQLVEAGYDVQSVREKVRDTIMPRYPNLYSWINKDSDTTLKVEIFERSNGQVAILTLTFPLKVVIKKHQNKNRP